MQWERRNRRDKLNQAIESAIVAAIADAESDYDDNDADTMRAFLALWMSWELPETTAIDKERTPLEEVSP